MAATAPDDVRKLAARLRFRHLQLLLALRQGGSLRAAAQAMNLTQPALSKALGEIEAAFGCPLFVRTPRGLTPNARGEVALRGAALLLEELSHVQAEVLQGDHAAAVLRVGAPPFVAHGLLPEVLQRLTTRDPPLRVELVEERVPLLLEMLGDGRLDALVSSYAGRLPTGLGAGWQIRKLSEVEFSIIAPRAHPLARSRRIGWDRLASEPWVLPAAAAMGRQLLDETFLRAGCAPPRPVVVSSNPVTNVRLVAAGVGLGVVPATTLKQLALAEQVARLAVQPGVPAAPVALIARAGVKNPRVEHLRKALEA
ncbi:MAG TPA: LysR substrate-binding domain-containing protein [Ramlibacter sp.]|nr:LysR substrate-binding domain-containing protein [Ramlibacter sp.]